MGRVAVQEHRSQGGDAAAVSRAIRLLRKSLGLTQAQLAQKLPVRQNSVSRYELGSIKPSRQVLFMLMLLAREHGDQQPFEDAFSDAGVESTADRANTSVAPVSGGADRTARSVEGSDG